jgi:hypothetical protein
MPRQQTLRVQAPVYARRRSKIQGDCVPDAVEVGDGVVQTIFSESLESKYGNNGTIIRTCCQIYVLEGRTGSVGIARPKSIWSRNCVIKFESYKSTPNYEGETSPRRDFFSKSSSIVFIKILAIISHYIEAQETKKMARTVDGMPHLRLWEKYVFKLFLRAILSNSIRVSQLYCCSSCLISPFPRVGRLNCVGAKRAAMRASFLASPRTSEWTR